MEKYSKKEMDNFLARQSAQSRFNLNNIAHHQHSGINNPQIAASTVTYMGLIGATGTIGFMPRGWTITLFPQSFTLTASVSAGATSATLNVGWPYATSSSQATITFSTGETRPVNVFNSIAGITWPGGLTNAANSSVTITVPGVYVISHNLNTLLYGVTIQPYHNLAVFPPPEFTVQVFTDSTAFEVTLIDVGSDLVTGGQFFFNLTAVANKNTPNPSYASTNYIQTGILN